MQKATNLCKPKEYYLSDHELRKRHERALPPKEAYLYFPIVKEIIEYNPMKPEKTLRRIFSGVDFTDYEKSKLVDFYKEIEKRNIIIPQWWEETETNRFLQATRFNITKTISIIEEQILWKQSYFPLNITDKTISILNSGFMYIHGRDRHFRPVFVIQAAIYFQIRDKYTYDEIFLAIIYFLEYILHNLLILGQVENWITISDLTNVNIVFMPKDLKRLSEALSSCYRCRLYKNYILGLSPAITWLYKIATSFVDEVILQKLCVVEKNRWDVIRENIHEDNYEAKFGGNAPNLSQGPNTYFPPVMPSDNYGIPQEENFLISEFEYKKRCNSNDKGKPAEIGQYYKQKWICETMAEERERAKEEEQIKQKELKQPPLLEIKTMKTLNFLRNKWKDEDNNPIRNAKTTVKKDEWEVNDEYQPGDNYHSFSSSSMQFSGLSAIINLSNLNNTTPKMGHLTPSNSKSSGIIIKESFSDNTDLVKG